MDAVNFTYWLQGFAELNQGPPSAEQWQAIREHLQLVFNKVTPPFPGIIKQGPGHEFAPNPSITPSIWPTPNAATQKYSDVTVTC